MSFLSIQPKGEIGYFSLSIVKDLKRNKKNRKYKHFFNTGDGGITFKCSVMMKRDVKYNTTNFTEVLNDWYRYSDPVTITTDAIDVPNGDYLITKNPSRKQTSENYTQWELEFTTYNELKVWKFQNDNSEVLRALNKSTSDKNKTKLKETIALGALQVTFALCPLNQLKYSSKKKSVECVKTLQKLLKKYGLYVNGKVDGWYGKDTMNAVKKYQTKTNLKATGKMNSKTMQYLVNGVTTSKTYVAKKVAKELLNTLGAS